MATKRIRINFSETSKAVQADTTIELDTDDKTTYEEVLAEAKKLFEEAFAYAQTKTMLK